MHVPAVRSARPGRFWLEKEEDGAGSRHFADIDELYLWEWAGNARGE